MSGSNNKLYAFIQRNLPKTEATLLLNSTVTSDEFNESNRLALNRSLLRTLFRYKLRNPNKRIYQVLLYISNDGTIEDWKHYFNDHIKQFIITNRMFNSVFNKPYKIKDDK